MADANGLNLQPPSQDLDKTIKTLAEAAESAKILTPEAFEQLKKQFGTETLWDQIQVADYLGKLLQAKGQSINNVNSALQGEDLAVKLHATKMPAARVDF